MSSTSDNAAGTDWSRRLSAALLNGDRRALSRAITLVESARAEDREAADAVLDTVLGRTGDSIRLGLSGAPGAGKSSFIDVFGSYLIDQGHRVAVLAVDPSSARGGGTIMGDKTRMPGLARRDAAFIRPSPAGDTVGGVARRTHEAILLVEAAGYDVVLVETVGVGQAETAVDDMVDMFLLLVAPGGGDDLQGIKRGAVELADAIVVTKADGELSAAAERARAQYAAALTLLRPKHPDWQPRVIPTSAHEATGMEMLWNAVTAFRETLGPAGLSEQRRRQAGQWLHREIRASLWAAFQADPSLAEKLGAAEQAVRASRRTPPAAARDLLENLFKESGGKD